jgi:hypothetical protein
MGRRRSAILGGRGKGKARTTRFASQSFLVTCFVLLACGDALIDFPIDDHSINIVDLVTPELAAMLAPDGSLPRQSPEANEGDIISGERAVELAHAYLQTFGTFFQRRFDRAHGGTLPLAQLQAGKEALYAESPYEPPAADLMAPDRRRVGPWYLVPFLLDSVPVLTVAVSAHNRDLWIEQGELRQPVIQGGSFRTVALSLRSHYPIPIAPESAVRLAAISTGARVARPPRLIRYGLPRAPTATYWQIKVDRPVRFEEERTGQIRTSQIVYISSDVRRLSNGEFVVEPNFVLPADTQPQAVQAEYVARLPDDLADPIEFGTMTLQLKPDTPIHFVPATIARN